MLDRLNRLPEFQTRHVLAAVVFTGRPLLSVLSLVTTRYPRSQLLHILASQKGYAATSLSL